MNEFFTAWNGWGTGSSAALWVRGWMQMGLALWLQTSLLLGVGLWALHGLQKRKPGARSVLGRALLLATLAMVLVSGSLSLSGNGRLPALWKVSLPDNPSPALAPRITHSTPIFKAHVETSPDNRKLIASTEAETIEDRSASMPTRQELPKIAERESAPRVSSERPTTRQTGSGLSGFVWMAFGLWLSGALVLLIWLGACHVALWRLRRGAHRVQEAATLETLTQACAALNVRAPLLLRHGAAGSPFLTGLWRPAIVLPAKKGESVCDNESAIGAALENSLHAVFVHEATHLKRRDLWWNTGGRIACALLWPQPLLWMLCRKLEQINEDACDQAVLSAGCEPQQYARCLLDWAERMTPRPIERVAGAGVLTGRSSLARRVQTILDGSGRSGHVSKRMRWAIGGSVLIGVIAMPFLVSIQAQAQKPLAETLKKPTANGERMLQHFKETSDDFVYVGGVSKGVLQAVSIRQKRGRKATELILARTARRTAADSTRWTLNDVAFYTFDDDKGLTMEARFEQLRIDLPAISEFLAAQSGAKSEPVPAGKWKAVQRDLGLPKAELGNLRRWATGRGRATVTGRVLDDEGKPVAGVKVILTLPYETMRGIAKSPRGMGVYSWLIALPKTARGVFSQTAVTGLDGTYRVSGLTTKTYEVGVPSQYRGIFGTDNLDSQQQVLTANRNVAAHEDQTVAAPDLTLTHGGLLHVRIEDKATGARLPGVAVFGQGGQPTAPSSLVISDASGESLIRVPAGKARVSIGGQSARGSWNLVAISNGLAYLISSGGDVALDGGTARSFQGTSNVQVVKGQTREVLLRLQKYTAPIPTPTPRLLPPPPGKATIIGRVVDEAGRPVGGIPVLAQIQQKAQWPLMQGAGLAYSNGNTPHWRQKWASIDQVLNESAITRADGSFRLNGLTTAPYNLIIGASGDYFGLRPPSGWVAPAIEGAWAKEGQVVRRAIPIVLTRGALLQGRVVDKATGLPLGGVIFGSNGPQLPKSSDDVMGAKSDRQGRFTLRVAPGTTSLYIAGPNQNALGENIVYADTGKRNDAYSIGTSRGLYAGSNRVQFEIDNGAPQFFNDRINIAAQRGQTRSLTLHLRRLVTKSARSKPQPVAASPGAISIIGRAQYEDGRPAGGVAVVAVARSQPNLSMSGPKLPDPRSTVTRADGVFRLTGLAPISYNIMLGRAPREEQSRQAQWTAAAIENVRARSGLARMARPLVLKRGAVIEGEVLDRQSGQPIAGVRVGVEGPHRRESSDGILYSVSDRNGRYRLRVPPGTISLYIYGPWADIPQTGLRFADTGTEDNSNGVGRFAGRFYSITNSVEVQIDGGRRAYQERKSPQMRFIPVRDGQTRHVSLRLRRMVPVQLQPIPPATARLQGRVTLEDGRPASGVRVVANIQRTAQLKLWHDVLGEKFYGRYPAKFLGMIFASTYTRADGTYDLSGLTSAPYDVLAEGEPIKRVAPARLNIKNSTLSGNLGFESGGGLSNLFGAAAIINSTIAGNMAGESDGVGGGIAVQNGTVSVNSSTVAGNFARDSGGIYYRATLNLQNSIVADNSAATNPNLRRFGLGALNDQGFNLIDGDPKLGPLADNGGPTFTRAPLPGSPALDAGKDASSTDQRGRFRPFNFGDVVNASGGNGADIGAVELNESAQSGPNFVVNNASDQDDSVCGLTDCSLREAINAANNGAGVDAITFAPSAFATRKTITVSKELPDITTDMSISAPVVGVVISLSKAVGNGLFTVQRGVLSLTNLSIRTNYIGVFVRGEAKLQGCTLTGIGGIGIGILIQGGRATVQNCTIAGNRSRGIEVTANGAIKIQNCTIAYNGRGIVNNTLQRPNSANVIALSNSIVAGNTTNIEGALQSDDHNITRGTAAQAGLYPDGIKENGGPTKTIALLVGSPAIDAGTSTLKTDQRGRARPFDAANAANASGSNASDLGAYEAQDTRQTAPNFSVNRTDDHDDGICGTTDCSLREAINAANRDSLDNAITFDALVFATRQTIVLNGAQLTVDFFGGEIRISAPLVGLVIDGNGKSRVMGVSGRAVLVGLTIRGGNVVNRARDYFGGGISVAGTLLLQNCTLSGNSAGGGGAIFSFGTLGAVDDGLTLRNCTLSGNTAEVGGAIYNISGFVVIENSTITHNTAPAGNGSGVASYGAMYSIGAGMARTEVSNSIIAGNTNSDVDRVGYSINAFQSNGFNLIGTGEAADVFGNEGDQIIGGASPGLDGLRDNGGPAFTHALLRGSPALNAGSTQLITDQRGFERVGRPDIGAFEFEGRAAPITGTITPAAAVDPANQARTFTATYSDYNGALDIALVGFRISGSGNNSTNSLLCVYNATTDKLSIYNDGATTVIGSVTPGTATTLSNSQGSLNCGATTVSRSGNVLTVNWNVSATGAFAGIKQPTFLFVRDASGLLDGYDQAGTWTISGNEHPSTVSVDPASASDASGAERFFTTVFSDSNGWKNLSFVTLRLGGSGTGTATNNANAMICVYNVQRNKLYLFNDSGSYNPDQASFPGRAVVLSNSQGSLDCARTTISGSGNTLTVKWSVKAGASFVGSRAIALLCADRANLRDGYDTYGIWTITGASGAAASPGVSKASAAGDAVSLVFTGAAPQSGYAVAVNGMSVEVTGVSVQGSKVGLQLAQPLHAGDAVVVTWPGGSKTLTAS